MKKIVECVPNISEGRNKEVIDRIVDAARGKGIKVLDVDPGAATNRTVITLAGDPEAILEAAFKLIKAAAEQIDMRQHKGEHPRIGATDVCPFVPVQNVTLEECIDLAKRLGKRVGEELGVPVYLYEEAASTPQRRPLANLRIGEYEGLPEKLRDPKMQPDFGPAEFIPRSGATVIGARPFLIAYNLNLNTKDRKVAQQIAGKLRESGYKRKDEKGQQVLEPGRFQHCRAVGWFIQEFGIAQVSINLTNFEVTGMHDVFDAADELARELGVRVTGSEVVGLVPKEALLRAGKHYRSKQKSISAVPESELINMAVRSLGLSELSVFDSSKKIIEERISEPAKLASLSLNKFVDLLSTDAPVPGGGSVAALAGALSAALISMVGALSFAKIKPKDSARRGKIENWGREAQTLKARLMESVDADTAAFEGVISAFRIKPTTVQGELEKNQKIVEAYMRATEVPLSVVEDSLGALRIARTALKEGMESAFSDSAVAARMAYVALLGGVYNVKINLRELREHFGNSGDVALGSFITESEGRLHQTQALASELMDQITEVINSKL